MPPLCLLVFKVPRLVPNRIAHWALYLPPEDGETGDGRIYSVKKAALSSKKTQLVVDEYDPYREDIISIPLPDINIGAAQLKAICDEVTKDRRFNLLNQNCQVWVAEVVTK